jgi:polysaccharide biosynthesis transport protein
MSLSKAGAEEPRLNSHTDEELSLHDLLVVFKRRRKIVYGSVLLFVGLAALYCVVCTRRYQASGTIQIQKEGSDGMGLESLMGGAADASDSMTANLTLQTQANILQSDTLALRTIENLHMEQTRDFQPRWSPIGALIGLISPSGVKDATGATLENSPGRRSRVLKTFSDNLKVKPVSGTRMIEIDYTNPDPKLAAAVVNELAQDLIDYNFQTRFKATNTASEWLAGQLNELREQSKGLQAKVVDLEKQSGVYSLGTTDSTGKQQAYSNVLDQLQQSTAALGIAEQNRILKGAIAQAAQSGNAEMLSGLAGNAASTGTGGNALQLLQSLRQQEATEKAALKEAEAKYGPSYPKLNEIREHIAGMDRAIQEEVQRIKARAKSDYSVAQQNEASTRAQYEKSKQDADHLNDKMINFTIARQEAEQSQELYSDLLKRLKEAGVLEGLKSSNITVVDPGRTPAKPKKPDVVLYIAVAFLGGFVAGALSAFLVDVLDRKVNGVDAVEGLLGTKIIGATPLIEISAMSMEEQSRRIDILRDSESTYAEAVRAIRTAVFLTGKAQQSRVILITSSIPGEGKSTFALNFAVALAQSKRKVLLVDMDLRKGSLQQRLGVTAGSGLSEVLAGLQAEAEINPVQDVENLDFLRAGSTPPNPSELLESAVGEQIQQWRSQYDVVVIDCAPLLPVTDSLIVHPYADVTLLIARNGLTERSQLQRSYHLLTDGSQHYVGVVLNCLDPREDSYYGYYGYRKYSYHYGENDHA